MRVLQSRLWLMLAIISPWTVNAESISSRLENMEDSIILQEEAIHDIRDKMDYELDVSGYADLEYIVESHAVSRFRLHHLSLFFQKKLSEDWHFFSEVEFEDAPKHDLTNGTVAGNDEVAIGDAYGKLFVESMNFTYKIKPWLNARAGRTHTPTGIWAINGHPPFVSTQERPLHIRKIIPQLIDGLNVFGTMPLNNMYASYDLFIANGDGNTGHGDNNQPKAYGARGNSQLMLTSKASLDLGGSYYHDLRGDGIRREGVAAHAKLRLINLDVQGEAAYGRDSGASSINRSGLYVQGMWHMGVSAAGYRWDQFDENRADGVDKAANTFFFNYRFTPNLVLKAEYHSYKGKGVTEITTKTLFSIAAYLD